ncbi:VWA domain-containing protein [Georgenia satyanarayanai]|uniref:VWA domain-containing protein n=1 Tax=Georgenia satyanarayanai TaxID=860221 RepID=UPI001264AA02|nr:VWA domain-containing protein [Georgenia satyanarayanai]
MADDATTRGGGGLARVLAVLVVVVVLALLAWGLLRDDGAAPDATGAPGPTTAGCAQELTVPVTTTPDFAPVVVAAADRVEDADPCTTYSVATSSAADTAEQLRGGTVPSRVWIPDSDVWVERVNQDPGAPALTAGPTLAWTPVLVAVPATLAESTGASGPQPWPEILSGPLAPRIADPTESTASLLLLHSAHAALAGTPGGDQLLGAAMIQMSRLVADPDELVRYAGNDAEGVSAVVATEQQVVQQRAVNAVTPLEVVVPAEGTGALTYSWVPLPGTDNGVGMRAALAALEEALTGVAGVADVRAAGFRAPGDDAGPGLVGDPAGVLPQPAAADADAVVTLWRTVAVDMRMLAVIDVSGSMLQPAGDRTRIALAGASAQTALSVFPLTSQVGLWVFSTDHPGGTDWTELAPVLPLHAESGAGIHRDALLEAAAALSDHVRPGADTGLYDTVLDAYRQVQETYEPGYVNSVVLLTDGVNEDDDGISLDELLAELQARIDPSRPVPVITVGMGPGADEEVLRLISAQTGGRSYLARDPADIRTVFVDALTHRPRPG